MNDIKLLGITLTYNEAFRVPYVMQYYERMNIDKLIVFDNESTDNTKELLEQYPFVEIHTFASNNQMDDISLIEMKNNVWKQYANEYDWCIVCDFDEVIYTPSDFKAELLQATAQGQTIYRSIMTDIFSRNLPPINKELVHININWGIDGNPLYANKALMFNLHSIQEINYSPGAHSCKPIGDIKFFEGNFHTYHLKSLDFNLLLEKNLIYAKRLSERNLKNNYSSHYAKSNTKETLELTYANAEKNGRVLSEPKVPKCAIIVPVYTTQLSFLEIISLRRTIQIWGNKYDIILVGPQGLDYTLFSESFHYSKFKAAQFDPKYFKNNLSYSDLLLQPGFYQVFWEYDFLQIAQLDTYVFEDKLEYFMSLGYDYIGGLHKHYGTNTAYEFSVGNGGFSLRNTQACLNVLLNYSKQIAEYTICEDRVFGEACVNVIKVAPEPIAKIYAYHDDPEIFYEESGHKLPMGAHAINKHMDFYYDKMETYPLVSIIVPVYNMEKYVVDTLNSIKAQSYENWECVIINDGSTDNSENIILNYIADKPKFKYIYQPNAGVAAARNNAIRSSQGKYILPVDPDDIILTDYVKEAVTFLETHSDYALFYSSAIFFGVNGADFSHFAYNGYRDLLFSNKIHNSALYKRVDFDRIGGYNEKLKGYEDWEFYIRLLYNNDKVQMLSTPYCLFRASESSRNATALKNHSVNVKAVVEANFNIFTEYGLSFNNPKSDNE